MYFGYSLLIPLIIAIPNLLFIVYPPVDSLVQEKEGRSVWLIMERVGQVGVFVLPLFYPVDFASVGDSISLSIMIAAISGYYYCWCRFFQQRRTYFKLFLPLGPIPVPLAIFPGIYFAGAAWLQQSVPLMLATICLVIGHWPISYRTAKKLKT